MNLTYRDHDDVWRIVRQKNMYQRERQIDAAIDILAERARQKVTGTWSAPARACWGRPPQLSTEKRLRMNRRVKTSFPTKIGKQPCCRSFVEVLGASCEFDQELLNSRSLSTSNEKKLASTVRSTSELIVDTSVASSRKDALCATCLMWRDRFRGRLPERRRRV